MLRVVGLLVICLVMVIRTSDALSCFPCDRITCGTATECNYGVGRDVCGCCPKCLKGPGDKCGGPWRIYGTCGEDFTCQLENEGNFNASGVCVLTTEDNEIREKRGLASSRKAGLSQVQARQHSHKAHGGIPEHIKAMLRAKGVNI